MFKAPLTSKAMKHRINSIYHIYFYGCDQGIHIMVYQNEQPLTCKKERLKPMRDFIAKQNSRIFKGGLQLEKENDSINIIARKIDIGSVPVSVFVEALDSAKSLPYYISCSESAQTN
jgi:hypothetical protein